MSANASGPAYYQRAGEGYARTRHPDPRIAGAIHVALGDARSVLNVGAGPGSYEPMDRSVLALDPSPVMLSQRTSKTPSIQGCAEALPFRDGAFDTAMALLTVHHWSDWRLGVREMQRVARRIVMLTFDTEFEPAFWLCDYFPEILVRDRERMPLIADLQTAMGATVTPVTVPHDCADGFLGAFWRAPEQYLRKEVRSGMSAFALMSDDERRRGLSRLESDILSGAWAKRNARLLDLDELDLGYRILVSGEIPGTREGGPE